MLLSCCLLCKIDEFWLGSFAVPVIEYIQIFCIIFRVISILAILYRIYPILIILDNKFILFNNPNLIQNNIILQRIEIKYKNSSLRIFWTRLQLFKKIIIVYYRFVYSEMVQKWWLDRIVMSVFGFIVEIFWGYVEMGL